MLVERLLIIGGVTLAVLLVWGGIRYWQARTVRSLAQKTPFTGLVPVGKPAVVAFTTPGCRECHFRQSPALARLAGAVNDQVTICTLQAADYPQLVTQLGILTAPATVVLDARGVVRHINLGFVDTPVLLQQVGLLTREVGIRQTAVAG
ncbi:thioredoxin family protein [Chloroflexus sp.]|uniref:peroxiredoxin family protein n=1 Tax=Chloroflexus sp. TaxID=1904827 RepID=UPI002ADD83DB|nr:thioredoxin family protein [Chloroflexus sp.]